MEQGTGGNCGFPAPVKGGSLTVEFFCPPEGGELLSTVEW